ncbi:4Fe-4S ferredoxin iron-sulfur binding domain protein [Segniliparus rotundus DSM 44985]|uniref:Ferredoxin n=1 Tax=Segniliparus rotundus (strain ATCC BAA-972 / CDC 1076 / CIP 108378 / DSM 44985 / JCM 13578) TaxID=640132 RepID=D6ZE35_SEGRD|nr:ferredoxin [Segniliparus rotundus]ADG97315.1 4Fe-4S ferredoxin iron-sulfur binding domain protein [Segniliparus rotundus DSM 44985]
MAFVVAEPCVDVIDRSCVEECPVDCMYLGKRMVYINPDLCIDCGACESVCPVEAIYNEEDLPDEWSAFKEANAQFFEGVEGLPEPGSCVGNASELGELGRDAPYVAALPARS